LDLKFHIPALSKVSITAVHDLGYTWIVCRLTVSRRLYVLLLSGVHSPGPMLQMDVQYVKFRHSSFRPRSITRAREVK
jgi:hypothetical protein